MLDNIIKKLTIILVLCASIVGVLYFAGLGAFLKGQAEEKVKQKVEEFKEEVKEKLDIKKEEVKVEVEKVEDKIEEVKNKVDDKINDLKKVKLKEILK